MVPVGRESQSWKLEKTGSLGAAPLAWPPVRRAGYLATGAEVSVCWLGVVKGWEELNRRARADSENKVLGGHHIGLGTWWW